MAITMPDRKRLLVGVAIWVAIWPLLSLGKFLAYELNPRIGMLRERVGREVVFIPEDESIFDVPWTGTLIDMRYRANDCLGFFDLEVEIRGEEHGIGTGLSPWELSRIRIPITSGGDRKARNPQAGIRNPVESENPARIRGEAPVTDGE
jgi:hypothetical protein